MFCDDSEAMISQQFSGGAVEEAGLPMRRISCRQRYRTQRRALVETTALHQIAEDPMARRAFRDLRSWILGGEAASSNLHEVETETGARVREVARLLLQEHVESRGIGVVGDAIEIDDGEGMGDLLTARSVR